MRIIGKRCIRGAAVTRRNVGYTPDLYTDPELTRPRSPPQRQATDCWPLHAPQAIHGFASLPPAVGQIVEPEVLTVPEDAFPPELAAIRDEVGNWSQFIVDAHIRSWYDARCKQPHKSRTACRIPCTYDRYDSISPDGEFLETVRALLMLLFGKLTRRCFRAKREFLCFPTGALRYALLPILTYTALALYAYITLYAPTLPSYSTAPLPYHPILLPCTLDQLP